MNNTRKISDGNRHRLIDRRKFLGTVATGTAIATAGCTEGGGSGDKGGKDEIHVLVDYGTEKWKSHWDNLTQQFKTNTDYTLNIETAATTGQIERIQTLIQGGSPPGVSIQTKTQLGPVLASADVLDVNDINQAIKDTYGSILQENTLDLGDRTAMVPFGLYAGGVWLFRSDIFESLSLDGPAETWDELLNYCQLISEDSSISAAPVSIAGDPSGAKGGSDFINLLYNAGGGIYRWKSDAQKEIEIWFDEDKVIETLEFAQQLTDYAPPPSEMGWGTANKQFAQGKLAQMIMSNGWATGIAAAMGNEQVVNGTDVGLVPKQEGADTWDRGWSYYDAAVLWKGSDNPQGSKQFMEWITTDKKRYATSLTKDPMRLLPFSESVLEVDAYKNSEPFTQYDSALLEQHKKTLNEIVPELQSKKRPFNSIEMQYVSGFNIEGEMMNQVLASGVSPQQAYSDALDRFESRLQEAKEKFN